MKRLWRGAVVAWHWKPHWLAMFLFGGFVAIVAAYTFDEMLRSRMAGWIAYTYEKQAAEARLVEGLNAARLPVQLDKDKADAAQLQFLQDQQAARSRLLDTLSKD